MQSPFSSKQEVMPMEPSGQCEMIHWYSDASSGGFVCEATSPEPQKPRLLDRVREEIRKRHYSLRTEKTYVGWIRRFCSTASATLPGWARRRYPAIFRTLPSPER